MPYKVENPSRIIELYTQGELPNFLKCAYLIEVVVPTLKLLLEFLKEKIKDKEYHSKEELEKELNEWPPYCKKHDFELPADFSQLALTENAINTEIVFCDQNGECNQGFFIAKVVKKPKHK